MVLVDNDRWRGEFPLDRNDRYLFTIEAWTDLFASWERGFRKKAEAGRDVASDLLEGIAFIESAARRAKDADRTAIDAALERLRALGEPRDAVAIVSDQQLLGLMARWGERSSATEYRPLLEVIADRPLARFGAWYEMFPRSQGNIPGRAATLREAERRLPEIRDLGFDVVYLPPIHPIGHTHRKGPNNSLIRAARQSRQSMGDRQRGRRPYRGRAGARQSRRFRSFRVGGPAPGTGSRYRLRNPMLARPSVGARASRMVPPSARRLDQVCGESAQGVPGHLSARFRGAGGRSADGSAARKWCCSGSVMACGFSGSTTRIPSR